MCPPCLPPTPALYAAAPKPEVKGQVWVVVEQQQRELHRGVWAAKWTF